MGKLIAPPGTVRLSGRNSRLPVKRTPSVNCNEPVTEAGEFGLLETVIKDTSSGNAQRVAFNSSGTGPPTRALNAPASLHRAVTGMSATAPLKLPTIFAPRSSSTPLRRDAVWVRALNSRLEALKLPRSSES